MQNLKTHQSESSDNRSSSRSAGGAPVDPLEAHMRARQMVDPKDTRATHAYTRLAIDPAAMPPLPPRKPATHGKFMTALTELIRPESGDTQPAHKAVTPPATRTAPPAASGAPVPAQKPAPQRVASAAIVSSPPAPAPAPVSAPRSASYGNGNAVNVKDVRFGNHPDKTRVVFDLNGSAGFDFNLSADKKTLTITLSGAGWDAVQSRTVNHPYIASYNANRQGDGTAVRMTMKRPIEFMKWADLPPDAGRSHRIYFDIAPL